MKFSREVRLAAVQVMAITNGTLEKLCTRLYDVNMEVRIATYTRLAKDVELQDLSLDQRNFILRAGLHDR